MLGYTTLVVRSQQNQEHLELGGEIHTNTYTTNTYTIEPNKEVIQVYKLIE